jgi:DNA primase
VVGFGGRALGEEKGAKYLNTPETPLYKKSKVLYGIDRARETIRRTRAAVLVEGYFDVIGLHQAGVQNAVAVCGTALTPEHVELLKRLDCREVTVLFDGDAAGLAAPAKAAQALFPSGLAGKVAVLPSEGGKIDPDDFARAHGRAGVEDLLAGAAPLSEFLVERAVERACGARGKDAALEAKLAAVRELKPFVALLPEGLARSTFEAAIAKRLDLDGEALRAELEGRAGARARAEAGGGLRPSAPARRGPPARVRVLLPGPAADALAVLAAYPDLAEVADEEGLVQLLPAGPLADVARDLLAGKLTSEEALARVDASADERTARRVRDLAGPGRPKPEDAPRELRRAVLKASIEAIRDEQDRLLALVARKGSPVPQELQTQAQVAARRRADLERRLRSLERIG